MKIVDDLGEILFCLVLSRDIGKPNAVARRDINLCIALSHAEGHRVRSARLRHQFFRHILSECGKKQNRQNDRQEKAEKRRHPLFDIAGELCPRAIETLGQSRVIHRARFINLLVVFIRKNDLGIADFHFSDVLLFHHFHKGAVIDLFDSGVGNHRGDDHIEKQNDEQYDAVIID